MSQVTFDSVSKRFDGGVVAVDELSLGVEEGEFLILVGPSGCGKTTALRMVAGLEDVTSGEIRIGDRVVNQLPPPQRDIAMVFQNYALYPHMTVAENIAFPLQQQRVRRAEIRSRVDEVARLLGIEELLARRPRALSGGQRQRVAIGRALVRRPQAFLMDEPLSNLDAKLRVQMRAELISLHQRLGITTIYVTHDQTEAMTLGDRVVVLDRGRVRQIDSPDSLYRRPRNVFVASFVGSPPMNFLRGELAGGRLRMGGREVPAPDGSWAQLRDGAVVVGVRPENVHLDGDGTTSGVVEIAERLGPEILVHVAVEPALVADVRAEAAADGTEDGGAAPATVVARLDPAYVPEMGNRVALRLDPARLHLFDPQTGDSLAA